MSKVKTLLDTVGHRDHNFSSLERSEGFQVMTFLEELKRRPTHHENDPVFLRECDEIISEIKQHLD